MTIYYPDGAAGAAPKCRIYTTALMPALRAITTRAKYDTPRDRVYAIFKLTASHAVHRTRRLAIANRSLVEALIQVKQCHRYHVSVVGSRKSPSPSEAKCIITLILLQRRILPHDAKNLLKWRNNV